jgi:hypothetical protein
MKKSTLPFLINLSPFSPALKIAGLSLLAASALSAQEVIGDNFNNDFNLGFDVVGTVPPTLDPAFAGNFWEPISATFPATLTAGAGQTGAGDGAVVVEVESGAMIDFGVDPDFTPSGLYEISIDFEIGTFTGSTGRFDRGFWVGFNSDGQVGRPGFRGVGVEPNGRVFAGRTWNWGSGSTPDGNLTVEVDNVGALTAGTWYNLSAIFNLDTGGIESVLFDGAPVDMSSFTDTPFSGNRIDQIGFIANSDSFDVPQQDPDADPILTSASVDNFSVTVVPEPSSFALFSAFLAFGWVAMRRRR